MLHTYTHTHNYTAFIFKTMCFTFFEQSCIIIQHNNKNNSDTTFDLYQPGDL